MTNMEGEASWVSHCFGGVRREIPVFKAFSETTEDENKDSLASLDFIPDDLLLRILSYLPVASMLRAGSVCKRWNEIVSSRSFLCNFSGTLSQKPWYFMSMNSSDPKGFAYDPCLRKWFRFELPCIESPSWLVASSYGLLCFMDDDARSGVFVCNPITKEFKILKEPRIQFFDYSALALSVDRKLHNYTVAIVKSKQVPDDFLLWEVSIHVYDSETQLWVNCLKEALAGWRGGDESVICNGVLHFLIYSIRITDRSENRHALVMYDLHRRSCVSLTRNYIPVPCALTCGRLMNLKDNLVMVGSIGKPDRLNIVKGIGIWTLQKNEWQEVSRMPHKFFRGFGEFDDVFASSGADDLIYVQSYGTPALLTFDMNQKQWKWS